MTTQQLPPRAHHQVNSYTELVRRMRQEGLLDRAPRRYAVRVLVLVVGFVLATTALLTLGPTWWQLVVAVGFGVLFTQTAFLSHDAAHRQIFTSGRRNEWAARLLGTFVVGLSYGWWMRKHSRHHANPNKVDADEDIRPGVLLFTPEDAARRTGLAGRLTARQGWLFFPLLTLEGINLHVSAVRTVVEDRELKHRGAEAVLLESYGIVVRHLNRVGLGDRDPSPAPSSWPTGREGSPRDTRLPRARSGPPRG